VGGPDRPFKKCPVGKHEHLVADDVRMPADDPRNIRGQRHRGKMRHGIRKVQVDGIERALAMKLPGDQRQLWRNRQTSVQVEARCPKDRKSVQQRASGVAIAARDEVDIVDLVAKGGEEVLDVPLHPPGYLVVETAEAEDSHGRFTTSR
jgi:hypothetical protein